MIQAKSEAATVSPDSAKAARGFVAASIVSVAALIAYHSSFHVPLIFDDRRAIVENPSIRHLLPLGDVFSAPAATMLGSRPITNASFAVNYAAGGLNVDGYHLLNLLLHIVAALALWGIVRRTTTRINLARRPRDPIFDATIFATLVTTLWVVHPLLTGAVTYIAQRAEILMGCCYLGTLYAFIRAVDEERSSWLAASLFACAVGMLAKEVMVTAPLAVLLYDRLFISPTFRAAWQRRSWYYVALAATWVPLLLVLKSGLDPTVGVNRGVGVWSYALTECRALAIYLGRSIWPYPLIFDYGEDFIQSTSQAVPYVWAPVLLLGGCLVSLWRRWRESSFVLLWTILILVPTSSFVPVTQQPIAENRMYLPLAGILALGIGVAFVLVGRRAYAAIGAAVVAAIALSVARNQNYGSSIALWEDTLAKRPANPRAYHNLGTAYFESGRLKEAQECYRRELQLAPNSAEGQTSYSALLFANGAIAESIAHGLEAVRLEPQHALAHSNLAAALLSAGRADEGIAHLKQALAINPSLVQARTNLALALTNTGRPQEALEHFVRVLLTVHENAALYVSYGNALLTLGRNDLALAQYQAALAIQPNQPDTLWRIGIALFQAGRVAESVSQFQAALRLAPDAIDTHYCLGVALAQLGETQAAVIEMETVLRLKPDHENARQQLARLRAPPPKP